VAGPPRRWRSRRKSWALAAVALFIQALPRDLVAKASAGEAFASVRPSVIGRRGALLLVAGPVEAAYAEEAAPAEESLPVEKPKKEESFNERFIRENRERVAKEAKSNPLLLGFNLSSSYVEKEYSSEDILKFLPTIILSRRALDKIDFVLTQKNVNTTDPALFETVRKIVRREPVSVIRRQLYRWKSWTINNGLGEPGQIAYARTLRNLEDLDYQLLVISRITAKAGDAPGRVPDGVAVATVRSIRGTIEALDACLDLIPDKDKKESAAAADLVMKETPQQGR